jgi:hypothetical protein
VKSGKNLTLIVINLTAIAEGRASGCQFAPALKDWELLDNTTQDWWRPVGLDEPESKMLRFSLLPSSCGFVKL